MNPRISIYKIKCSLIPLVFAGFYGFFSLSLISYFLVNPEEIHIISLIITIIVSIGCVVALVFGIRNFIYTKKHMKELSDGKIIKLEIIGFLDSNKVVSDSSYTYRQYVIGYDKMTDRYYRSNGHYKYPNLRYTVGDTITMLYKSSDYFYMQTKEYIKNKR